MTPLLREWIRKASAIVFPGSPGKDSTLVRAVVEEGLGLSSVDSESVLRRLAERCSDDPMAAGAVERSQADSGRRGSHRTVSMYLRLRVMDRELLKAVAAAVRPDDSEKQPSASHVVRELLRSAFGLPSKDNGRTLSRLAKVRKRLPPISDIPSLRYQDSELRTMSRGKCRVASRKRTPPVTANCARPRGPRPDDRPIVQFQVARVRRQGGAYRPRVLPQKLARLQRHMPLDQAEAEALAAAERHLKQLIAPSPTSHQRFTARSP